MAILFDIQTYLVEHGKHFGAPSSAQRMALTDLLSAMGDDPRLVDVRHAAYMLATTWHETAKTMRPIAEYGKGKGCKYGRPGRNKNQVPYGRGFVQLTWDANYERADRELGLNGRLVADYDLAMNPAIAYQIMSLGMHEGWFTGKALKHYITGSRCDYLNARRIINGMDKASVIASYARHFEAALRAALVEKPLTIAKREEPVPQPGSFRASSGPFNETH